MKLEQFTPWFQILQIMEKHYAGGRLKWPLAVRLKAGGYHKLTATIVVCQNLKIWNTGLKMLKILWNFQNSPKIY
jgi:hypothetical protein